MIAQQSLWRGNCPGDQRGSSLRDSTNSRTYTSYVVGFRSAARPTGLPKSRTRLSRAEGGSAISPKQDASVFQGFRSEGVGRGTTCRCLRFLDVHMPSPRPSLVELFAWARSLYMAQHLSLRFVSRSTTYGREGFLSCVAWRAMTRLKVSVLCSVFHVLCYVFLCACFLGCFVSVGVRFVAVRCRPPTVFPSDGASLKRMNVGHAAACRTNFIGAKRRLFLCWCVKSAGTGRDQFFAFPGSHRFSTKR